MIRQTLALLLDAYRELNARKLFWIVLSISLLVAAAFALVLATFSHIYVLSALVGLATRSTITSLLLAGLFWFFIFLVQQSEQAFLGQQVTQEIAADIVRTDLQSSEAQLDAARKRTTDTPPADGHDPPAPLIHRVEDARTRLTAPD